ALEQLEDGLTPSTFIIANGDVAALVAAVNTCNTNGQDDTINLAAGGTYAFSAMADATDGGNALPLILGDGGHAFAVNGQGARFTRAAGAPSFRYFNVGVAAVTVNDQTMTGGVSDAGST